jgi:hypothetical protein
MHETAANRQNDILQSIDATLKEFLAMAKEDRAAKDGAKDNRKPHLETSDPKKAMDSPLVDEGVNTEAPAKAKTAADEKALKKASDK